MLDSIMRKVAKTVWDCRQARGEIALQAGGDLVDPAVAELLESHLAKCEGCRNYLVEMTASLEALQACALAPLPVQKKVQLWPDVAARLPASRRPSAAARFNVWVPTAAMAAACAVMVFVNVIQWERGGPIEPGFAPQFQSVIHREAPRHLVPDSPFVVPRRQFVRDPVRDGSLPVKLDAVPGFESSSRDREW